MVRLLLVARFGLLACCVCVCMHACAYMYIRSYCWRTWTWALCWFVDVLFSSSSPRPQWCGVERCTGTLVPGMFRKWCASACQCRCRHPSFPAWDVLSLETYSFGELSTPRCPSAKRSWLKFEVSESEQCCRCCYIFSSSKNIYQYVVVVVKVIGWTLNQEYGCTINILIVGYKTINQ